MTRHPPPTDPDAVRRAFHATYALDLQRQCIRRLAHYQRQFPHHAEIIAEEYLMLEEDERGDEGDGGQEVHSIERIGPYQVLDVLGRGGQAVVYLALHTQLNRKVALKVAHASSLDLLSDSDVRRFQREAALTSRLDHSGICSIFETGEDAGQIYIAMQYVRGETLAQKIANASSSSARRIVALPEPDETGRASEPAESSISLERRQVHRVLLLIEKAARALHVAHGHRLIHRDVKPANIIVTEAGDPVLLDFGIARDDESLGQSLTQSGDLIGTPYYMSPEQLTSPRVRIDPRSDVYSLGVTLYECLTLRRPFQAASRENLFQQILANVVPDPRGFNRALSTDVRTVLEMALERDRNRRYQTALDLAADLRRIRYFEPIRARPAGPLMRLRRWTQRNPAVATALLGTLLMLVVGIVISLTMLNEVETARRTAESRRIESEANERVARRSLSAAFMEKADRAIHDGDQGSAAIFAAAALVEREAGRESSGDDAEQVARLHSLHFDAEAGRRLRFLRELPWPGGTGSGPKFTGFAWPSFHPDGRRVAAVARGHVVIWDLEEEREPIVLAPAHPRQRFSWPTWSPDGRLLAIVASDHVRILEIATGELVGEAARGTSPTVLAFSPDSRILAISVRSKVAPLHRVLFWSIQKRKRTDEITLTEAKVKGMVYAPAGGQLAVGTEDSVVRLWDLAARRTVWQCGLTHWVSTRGLAFSADGSLLIAAGMDNKLWLFSGEDGRLLGNISTPRRPTTVAFLGASHDIIHGGYPGQGALRSIVTQKHRGMIHVEAPVRDVLHGARGELLAVAASPDGSKVITSGPGRLRLHAVEPPRGLTVRLGPHDGHPHFFVQSPDGRSLVTTTKWRTLHHWQIPPSGDPTKARVRAVAPPTGKRKWGDAICFSPDHRWLAVLGGGNNALLHFPSLEPAHQLESADAPFSVTGRPVCSPDGRMLFIGARDGKIHRWRIARGCFAAPLVGHGPAIWGLACSPDGKWLASGARDGEVRLWPLEGEREPVILRGHRRVVTGMAFSPDSRELVTSDADSEIIVWDVASHRHIKRLSGHSAWVNKVAWSPDGRLILSSSDDNTARLWDRRTGRVLQIFRCMEQAIAIAFTPDGGHFWVNDGLYLARHKVVVHDRIEDPRELLENAQGLIGMRRDGLGLVVIHTADGSGR